MSEEIRAACVQLNSTGEKDLNIERAELLVARAAGAELVLLPEKWNARGSSEDSVASAEPLEGGETVEAMRSWARRHGIVLVGGSIAERREGREKLSNTCVVFGKDGQTEAVYRKIHLFDVDVGGLVYRESDTEEPGDELTVCDLGGWRVGLSVCYDLRFPELYRIMAVEGAEIVTVPAAFTSFTGKDHWELLLRARAVENQCYVLAANEWGAYGDGRSSYGRSMIVDPWGIVLAQAADETPLSSPTSTRRCYDGSGRAFPRLRIGSRSPTAGRRWFERMTHNSAIPVMQPRTREARTAPRVGGQEAP